MLLANSSDLGFALFGILLAATIGGLINAIFIRAAAYWVFGVKIEFSAAYVISLFAYIVAFGFNLGVDALGMYGVGAGVLSVLLVLGTLTAGLFHKLNSWGRAAITAVASQGLGLAVFAGVALVIRAGAGA